MKRVFDSISRGLLLIAIGVVFFLMNYGVLSWNFWLHVVDLWPLILILAGIGLLLGRRIPFSAILLVFLLAMVGYSMAVGDQFEQWQNGNPLSGTTSSAQSLSVPLPDGVKKAHISLNLGGSQVQIQDLNSEDNAKPQLLTGEYQWMSRGSSRPGLSTAQSGDTMNVTLTPPTFGMNVKGPEINNHVKLNLSTKVHYDLDIDAGAIDGKIDLSRLLVDNFKLDTGASKFELVFGDTGVTTKGKIDSGASKVNLVIPENVGVRIHLSGVASSTNFMGSGLFIDEKNWASSNYETAKTKVDLDISTAAGSIQLDRSQANTNMNTTTY